MPMGMSGYQPVPYIQLVEPVVEPLGEAREMVDLRTPRRGLRRVPSAGSPWIQKVAQSVREDAGKLVARSCASRRACCSWR